MKYAFCSILVAILLVEHGYAVDVRRGTGNESSHFFASIEGSSKGSIAVDLPRLLSGQQYNLEVEIVEKAVREQNYAVTATCSCLKPHIQEVLENSVVLSILIDLTAKKDAVHQTVYLAASDGRVVEIAVNAEVGSSTATLDRKLVVLSSVFSDEKPVFLSIDPQFEKVARVYSEGTLLSIDCVDRQAGRHVYVLRSETPKPPGTRDKLIFDISTPLGTSEIILPVLYSEVSLGTVSPSHLVFGYLKGGETKSLGLLVEHEAGTTVRIAESRGLASEVLSESRNSTKYKFTLVAEAEGKIDVNIALELERNAGEDHKETIHVPVLAFVR